MSRVHRRFLPIAFCAVLTIHSGAAYSRHITMNNANLGILIPRSKMRADIPLGVVDPAHSVTLSGLTGGMHFESYERESCSPRHTTYIKGTVRNAALNTWEVGVAGIGVALATTNQITKQVEIITDKGTSYSVTFTGSSPNAYNWVRRAYIVRDGPVNSAPVAPTAGLTMYTDIIHPCTSSFHVVTGIFVGAGIPAAQTCTINNPNQQVTLGRATQGDQPATNNTPFIKGRAPFSFTLACPNLPANTPVRASWYDQSDTASTKNYLANTAAGAPKGLAIQALKSDGQTPYVMGTTETLRTGPGNVTVNGIAAYYRTEPIRTPGPVTSALSYSITYY